MSALPNGKSPIHTTGHIHSEFSVLSIEITPEERASGKPSAATVGRTVSILQRDGIVVVNDVVEYDHVDKINNILTEEAERLVKMEGTHFNLNPESRNISQVPPLTPDLMFDDIWANPYTTSIVSAMLGPCPSVQFVNGNTAIEGGKRQQVHADIDFQHLTFPFGIVANYYLSDTGPWNGSTEVWVGSHRDTVIEDHDGPSKPFIKQALLDKRRAIIPPIQPTIKRGSVVLRDLRLWHAGMPNHTETPRIMLAFVHFPWLYSNPLKLSLPASARSLTERWEGESGVKYPAEFTDGSVDHMKVEFKATFGAGNPNLVY